MKRVLLLSIAIIFGFSAFSQNSIVSNALQKKLDKSRNNTMEEVCIILWDQVDIDGLKEDFDNQKLVSSLRAQRLQGIMTRHAQKTQKALLDYLHKESITDIYQYWIVNMLVVKLPLNMVQKLSERSDVGYLMLNNEFEAQLIKPVEMSPSNPKSIGGTEPGLIAINAHKMWALGYTGRGRILYTMDTGVWPNNPGLGGRFLGDYYPMERAWYGFDSEFPHDKINSHGTHVTGTTLGLEKATNDTIGVAFNAYFMVSDPVVTQIADIKPYSDFALAYQWAFNPDGDTATTDDIPDVINNSWGRGPTTDTNLCHSPVSIMLTAIEAAGIANVYSAGNSGPGDSTISEPHHISTSLVNTFTVGAVNPHNPTYPIASFSSRGPTVCPVTGSLKIKPEVSAPGLDIRSCIGQNSYATYSGTSMAAPHTSGAILLLKEAFPYLTGEQLMLALYYSASDLGITGEDNTYGMGMIDVWAAYQLLSTTNTPVPPLQSNYDIAISEIKLPFSGFSCDSIFDIEIVVENRGISSMSNFIVNYWSGSYLHDSVIFANSIAPGQKDSLIISSVKIKELGNIELFASIHSLANFTELDEINNRSVARFNLRPTEQLPFVEDFEYGSLVKNGWYVNNDDFENKWKTDSCGGIQFGTRSAMMSCFSYLPRAGQTDILLSPKLEIPSSGPIWLSYKYAYSVRNSFFKDTLKVYAVSTCNWNNKTLLWSKGVDSLSTFDTSAYYFVPYNASQWRDVKLDLSSYQGMGEIMIAFETVNGAGNNIWVDEIKCYQGNNLPNAIPEIESYNLKVYPNPVNSIVYIESSDDFYRNSRAQIIDISGKIVFEKELDNSSKKTSINVESLSKGLYIVLYSNVIETRRFKFVKL